jgi:hypothetical protein
MTSCLLHPPLSNYLKTKPEPEKVLSELKHHLGRKSDFCYPSPEKKCEREVSLHELPLVRGIYDQKASEENSTGLCNLLLPGMPTELQ